MSDTTRIEITELRNQVRALKRMLFGVFGLVIIGGLLAATTLQSVPDVIQAKKFEVVNDEGQLQVVLAANADGGGLAIANKDGKLVAAISTSADGGKLSIANKDGKPVAAIIANANGGSFGIANKDGKPAAGIVANADGGGEIETFDSKGQTTSTNP